MSIKEVIVTLILLGFEQKKHFLMGSFGSSSIISVWYQVKPQKFIVVCLKGYN